MRKTAMMEVMKMMIKTQLMANGHLRMSSS